MGYHALGGKCKGVRNPLNLTGIKSKDLNNINRGRQKPTRFQVNSFQWVTTHVANL